MSSGALANGDLILAACLLAINGALSLAFGLRLELGLAIAAIRTAVQLAVIGFVLKFVFAQSSPLWTAGVALLLFSVAGYELLQRQQRRFKGWWAYGFGNATLLFAGGLATVYSVAIVLGARPWYTPRYLLPILAMVLGSTLTSISAVLQTLTDGIERERGTIEARLAHGGTRFAALVPLLRRALRTATAPVFNVLSVAGMVALPGVMTGQILAGADPVDAAKFQMVLMFVLAGASGLGALAAALGGVLLLSDHRHRLRLDRLAPDG